MTIDSAFIMITSGGLSSANSIAELHVADGEQKECHCDRQKNRVLHRSFPPVDFSEDQNLTSIERSSRFSSFTKSGVNPGTTEPSGPVLPPGGVIPPRPEKYGTFAAR